MKDNCAQLARTKLYVYFFPLLGTDKEGAVILYYNFWSN